MDYTEYFCSKSLPNIASQGENTVPNDVSRNQLHIYKILFLRLARNVNNERSFLSHEC